MNVRPESADHWSRPTLSSSSTSKTATPKCPYAITRATGTPVGAITEGTLFYGEYLQCDSSTNEAVLIPDPFAPQLCANATCVSRVYLEIFQSSPSTLSYKQIYWRPNVGTTFAWKPDPNQIPQTVTTNTGYLLNWADHDWFLACLQDDKWKVYLQTGSDSPAGVTCVATQLKLGLVTAE
ncbi:hypothetical protein FRC00_003821 [Tulasnella sp. 408]|nr:hypothetical protein FRC00_003821 [Tulasnella sp. 408]